MNKELKRDIVKAILVSLIYVLLSFALGVTGASIMLFIKEDNDRCHYCQGKYEYSDFVVYGTAIVLGGLLRHLLLDDYINVLNSIL